MPIDWVEGMLRQGDSDPTEWESTVAFWEDHSPHQPAFLRAALMEYEGAWQELTVLAADWVLREEDDTEAWIALGLARLGLQQEKEAAVALRRAVELRPNSSRAWYWLSVAYHDLGLTEQFREATTKLAELDPNLVGRLKRAILDRAGGQSN